MKRVRLAVIILALVFALGATTTENLPPVPNPPQSRKLSRPDLAVLELWLKREGTMVRVESGKLEVVAGVVMVILDCRSESGQMAFTLIKVLGQLNRQEVYEPGFLP
jgi:hypothetical protein